MSRTSFFSVAPGEFSNIQTRPSRSQTHSRLESGTCVRPTELVNIRLVNATTAVQLPEMAGATSGSTPFKNGPVCGTELRAYGFAKEEIIEAPNNAIMTNHRQCTLIREKQCFTSQQ